MASVRIEEEAFADARIDLLASILKINKYEALGRLAYLWRTCTQLQQKTLSVKIIETMLGENGAEALCESGLAEKNKGDETQIRIKGTTGRIEWLGKLRKNGKFGRLGGRPKKNPQGLLKNPDGFDQKTPIAIAPAIVIANDRYISAAGKKSETPKPEIQTTSPPAVTVDTARQKTNELAQDLNLRWKPPGAEQEKEFASLLKQGAYEHIEAAMRETKARAAKPSWGYFLAVLETMTVKIPETGPPKENAFEAGNRIWREEIEAQAKAKGYA